MFKYYINDVEVKNIMAQPTATIIREDGIGNSEQILREKSTTTFDFAGDAYKRICELRDNYCQDMTLKITILCNDIQEDFFSGVIKHKDIEINPTKKIGKITAFVEFSFAAKIVLYQDTEIPLYYTRTLNCENIELERQGIKNANHIIKGYALAKNDYSINVLDAIKYLVGFITDNNVSVVSDYLTNNPIHISTGFALHSTAGTLNKLYPKITLKGLLEQLRKKTTLYAIFEYDSLGNPVYRIEDENYSYGNDVVMELDNFPLTFTEKMDDENIYNQIKVGSDETGTEDAIVVPQVRLKAWNNESYFGCGCTGIKDSVLDLVSSYIIDGNVIYEALRTGVGAEYGKDESVFMYAVESDGGGGWQIQGYVGNQLNTFMNNENVLNRWVGVANSCIALSRNAKYGFEVINNSNIPVNFDTYGTGISFTSDKNNIVGYSGASYIVYDNENSVNEQTSPPDPFTYFLCQENGNYTFKASGIFKQFPTTQNPNLDTDVIGADLYLSIEAWSGIGGVQIGYQEFVVNNCPNLNTNEVPMSLEATFGLTTGNIVFVRYRMVYTEVGFKQWAVASKNNQFLLLSDDYACEQIDDVTDNFRPFLGAFEYPLCYEDYKLLKNNKRGIIRVNGHDMWIKEVQYNSQELAEFILKYKRSVC